MEIYQNTSIPIKVISSEPYRDIVPIVDALASIHQKGLVHRDVKPGNIFVSDQDRLVLGDFGIVFPTEAEDRLTKLSTTQMLENC